MPELLRATLNVCGIVGIVLILIGVVIGYLMYNAPLVDKDGKFHKRSEYANKERHNKRRQ